MVEKTKAYIAGFLDGDGSIFFQLIRRKDYIFGYQVRGSVVFYQKTENKRILNWLIHKFRVGYLRDRKDHLSEYTIVGLKEVERVLIEIEPYLILKRKQAKLALKIINRFKEFNNKINSKILLEIAKDVDRFQKLNYSKKRLNTTKTLKEFFKVPVSTHKQSSQSLRFQM